RRGAERRTGRAGELLAASRPSAMRREHARCVRERQQLAVQRVVPGWRFVMASYHAPNGRYALRMAGACDARVMADCPLAGGIAWPENSGLGETVQESRPGRSGPSPGCPG